VHVISPLGRLSVLNVCACIEFAVSRLGSQFARLAKDTAIVGTATQSRRGRVSAERRVFTPSWRDCSSGLSSTAWPSRRCCRGPNRHSEVYHGYRIEVRRRDRRIARCDVVPAGANSHRECRTWLMDDERRSGNRVGGLQRSRASEVGPVLRGGQAHDAGTPDNRQASSWIKPDNFGGLARILQRLPRSDRAPTIARKLSETWQ
jgi:hypothetical protein